MPPRSRWSAVLMAELSVPSTNALTRMSDRNRVCRGFQPELLGTARGVASEHFGGLQISGET